MRIDHVAYRTACRDKTAKFFQEAFGYKVQTEFDIQFPDGTSCKCIALEPPEKEGLNKAQKTDKEILSTFNLSWTAVHQLTYNNDHWNVEYHMAPEIFVSSSDDPESIVARWVAHRDGIGGIHHIAYMVNSVEETMKEWKEKGYAEFSSEEPLSCPEDSLVQVFTKPSELCGVIFEFIERGEHGFCQANVKALMESTAQNQ